MNDAFSIEDRIHTLGYRLLETAGRVGTGFSPAWLDQLVSRAIGDPRFRVQALRFIDVLPTLQDDTELVQHLREYFSGYELPWPVLSKWGLKHSDAPWALHIAAPLVRATLRGLSRRFMGGNTVRQVLDTIIRLRSQGMDYTLDLLGEAVVSEQEAQDYQQACLEMLDGLHENRERLNDASSGAVCRSGANISLKLSSLYSQITPVDPESSVVAIARRLRPILTTAREQGASVTIDMEQYDFRHIVLQCFMTVLMEPEFRDWPDAGIAVQAYLKDAREDLQQLIDWAGKRGTPVQIRLVRGAYWDYETVIAHQHGWQVPVWEEKARTDASFEACLELLFSCPGTVKLAVASHNVRSLAGTMAYAESRGLSADMFEFQMLYGMADELKSALVELGYHLRVYVPFGETLPGMAYLVRRLLENSSGQTILDTGMAQARLDDASLEKPQPGVTVDNKRSIGYFHNQPVHRFTGREERVAFADALRAVKLELGKDYPLIINGAAVKGAGAIASTNPARPDEVIGMVAAADRAQAEQALAAARDAFPGWAGLTARERAGYLKKVAAALLQERDLFASWQVLETGKNWSEADADVCEAIDFLNYYAQQAEQLAGEHVNELGGEHNQLYYRPRGIGLVITPWNFPLAILTGMLSATIVCGNTAILKPSSLTPVIA
ncbi:MAG: proline dehydrogenase family protein, partial [Pseudomonadota bacterium]|nr:proline dehydrogenase family protein [Pseudomonadota bacterium]